MFTNGVAITSRKNRHRLHHRQGPVGVQSMKTSSNEQPGIVGVGPDQITPPLSQRRAPDCGVGRRRPQLIEKRWIADHAVGNWQLVEQSIAVRQIGQGPDLYLVVYAPQRQCRLGHGDRPGVDIDAEELSDDLCGPGATIHELVCSCNQERRSSDSRVEHPVR